MFGKKVVSLIFVADVQICADLRLQMAEAEWAWKTFTLGVTARRSILCH